MQIKYKTKRVVVPCCSECGEPLKGNGSLVSPYYCTCGTWEYKPGNIGEIGEFKKAKKVNYETLHPHP